MKSIRSYVLLGILCGSTLAAQDVVIYRIMIPQKIDGLIVPVAASTTHVAFSSIRMEPTWMSLGQAAGVAAHLAMKHDVPLRRVPVDELQLLLRQQGAVLEIPLAETK